MYQDFLPQPFLYPFLWHWIVKGHHFYIICRLGDRIWIQKDHWRDPLHSWYTHQAAFCWSLCIMATCLSTCVAQEKFKLSHFIFQAGEWKWGEAVEGSGREVPERWVHPLCLHRQKLIPVLSQRSRDGHNFPFCRRFVSWWTVYVFHRMGVPSLLSWSDFAV